MLLFVVYLASMEPVCPMKKTRKSCAIFPLDSAIKSCVSKNALSTYGLHLNLGLIAFLTSYSILSIEQFLEFCCIWNSLVCQSRCRIHICYPDSSFYVDLKVV